MGGVHDNLTTVCWMDKMEVCVEPSIGPPAAEGNFRDEPGNVLMKPQVVQHDMRVAYVAKSDITVWRDLRLQMEERGSRYGV